MMDGAAWKHTDGSMAVTVTTTDDSLILLLLKVLHERGLNLTYA